jgi:YVTN family beta-propeller protein
VAKARCTGVFSEASAERNFRIDLACIYPPAGKRTSEGETMNRFAMLFLAGSALLGSATPAATNYELLKKVPVAGTGGWDYVVVDETGRRVYISHSTQVDVLDADSLAFVGTIPNTPGAHGVAIASEFGRGYATAGKADAVVPFDLKTLQPMPMIKVGKKPDAIVYEPATKRVYVMNGDSDSITVLNAADGSLAGTMDLGGGPEYGAVDGKANFYVNLEEKNETLQIDVHTMKVEHRWPLAPCATPTALAMDVQNHRLFVGCRSKHLGVLDSDTGKLIFTAPIGERVDAGAFDPATKLVMLSTGDGKVTIFHQDTPDKYSLAQDLVTHAGSKTFGYDSKTKRLYVPSADNGAMQVLVYEQH